MFIYYRGWQKVFCPKASGDTMARRRMISNKITGPYNFRSMEPKHSCSFCLHADDGFVCNPRSYAMPTGCMQQTRFGDAEQRCYVIWFGIASSQKNRSPFKCRQNARTDGSLTNHVRNANCPLRQQSDLCTAVKTREPTAA